jgi:hypothetical protein
MFGSAGSIMSMANGFKAMIDAITMTNSGKPMGRWVDETQALALTSVTQRTSLIDTFGGSCCTAQEAFGDTSPVENVPSKIRHAADPSRSARAHHACVRGAFRMRARRLTLRDGG